MIEFRYKSGAPNAQRRACKDCVHLKAAVNLWCTNKKAVEAHGTNIPGTAQCAYWEPMLPIQKGEQESHRLLFVDLGDE